MTLPSSKTVLVVEDEPLVRIFACEILTDAGYLVVEASTADEALQLLDAGIAAVVTDIEMPGSIDGLQLARRIETQWPTIGVVIVSGRRLPNPDELPHRALFLAKPYSTEHLIDTVAASL
jgi:two-component system, response regulator PdtaR